MAAVAMFAAALEVFGRGQAAEFDGLADMAGDLGADPLHPLLGFHELAHGGVSQELVASAFEVGDFLLGEGQAHLLFLLQGLSFGQDAFVGRARGGITQEGVLLLLGGHHAGLVQDGLAEFAGLGEHGVLFDLSQHKNQWMFHSGPLGFGEWPAQ